MFIQFIRFLTVLSFMLMASMAQAQVSGQAFEGFQGNSKDPVQIEADQLDVIDAQSKAIFKGNVKVRQGTSVITTSTLVVEYVRGSGGGSGQGDIDRLIMSGGLVVTSKDNTVTGDKGIYSVRAEKIVLEGNVVISQGENVATGSRLNVDLKTNRAVLSGKNRVRTIIKPRQRPKS